LIMWNKAFMVLFLFFSSNSYASDGKFTFIQEDQPAPFTGTLFDPEATARLLANNKFLKEEYDLKLGFELDKQAAQYELKIDQLNITIDTERERFETTLSLKNTEIEQLNKIIAKKPGKNALIWGVIGGFVVGVGATVGLTYAVNK
jgi:hypothetical protein